MTLVRLELVVVGFAIVGVLLFLLSDRSEKREVVANGGAIPLAQPASEHFGLPAMEDIRLQPIAHELDVLHASHTFPADDIELLENILRQYRRAFGQNPIGLNEEIVAALAGRNDRAAALISPEHPAIDARGRLLDRWALRTFSTRVRDKKWRSARRVRTGSCSPGTT